MQLPTAMILATDTATYWFAGILTVAASLIVVVVMLVASRADNGDPS